jgi:ATP-dependent helicase HepA
LDPDRYSDFESFQKEAEGFGAVAEVAGKILELEPLNKADHESLKKIFNKDPEGLDEHLQALAKNEPGARDRLIKALLDEHGTGRVVFRNTRANMTGFPERKLRAAPLKDVGETIINRVAREIEAEEGVGDATVRYSFKDDPRVAWLLSFLQENQTAKVLLICKTQRKVLALESALQEMTAAKIGLFHEGLPLVKRDRNAAWFAEPDGAQLLICSEIGSEGRNFQFAHHLVLFDLPLNPGLLEQRIGRLDRIGQTETINIHVPYIEGSAEQFILEWYQDGLNAFECPLHGGAEYQIRFRERLLELALAHGGTSKKAKPAVWKSFIKETAIFHEELTLKLKKGRDRLLELNSFDEGVAQSVIERVREVSADPFLRTFLIELLDHCGVRITEHEDGTIFIDPSHAYIEAFPSVPREGMLATFDRQRAIVREDIAFISLDHPLFRDALDLFINSTAGTTSFGFIEADARNILLEVGFVLEAVADSKWHIEQFLSPTPLRIVVDVRGNDLTEVRSEEGIAKEIEDSEIHRFLERPGFNAELLKAMIHGAKELAEVRASSLKKTSEDVADQQLRAEVQRLVDRKVK